MFKKNFVKRAMAFIMSAFISLSFLNCNVFAATASQQEPRLQQFDITEQMVSDKKDNTEQTVELSQLRSECKKVFRMPNGDLQALITQEPQNYYSDGEWKEIDNTLVETVKGDHRVYKNKSNDFNVEFPEFLNSNTKVNIKNGKYNLSFRLIKNSASSLSAELVTNNEAEKTTGDALQQVAQLEETNSGIFYADALNNTDVRYDLKSKKLKESIVLKNRSAISSEYLYEIAVSDLKAELQEDKSVVFYDPDEKTVKCIIPAPYMIDSAETPERSMNIDVELTLIDEDKYQLAYRPDLSWLNSDSRKYPVIIDPSVEWQNFGAFQSVYVDSKYPNENYSNKNSLRVSNSKYSLFQPSYMYQPDTYINQYVENYAGYEMRSAILNVRLGSDGTSATNTVRAEVSGSTFDCSSVTYNSMSSAIFTEIDSFVAGKDEKWYAIDLTPTWQKYAWKFSVRLRGDTSTELLGYSYNYYGNEHRPYILIGYSPKTGGIDDNRSYHSINMGRAGTVNIDDKSGKTVLVRQDMNAYNERLPFSFQSITDTRLKEYVQYNGRLATNTTCNLYLQIKYLNKDMGCIFVDEKGALQCLFPSDGKDESDPDIPENAKYWKNDNGYKLIGNVDENENLDYDTAYILTPANKRIDFDNRGFAVKISNSNQSKSNNISITFDNSNRISKITTASGVEYTLTYKQVTSDLTCLSSIKYINASGITCSVVYNHDANGNVTKVTYPDGKSVEYEYNSDGNLVKVQNINGQVLKLTYDASGRVKEVKKSNKLNAVGNSMTITYNGLIVTFEDNEGRQEVEQLNSDGRLCALFNRDGEPSYRACGIDQLDLTTNTVEMTDEGNMIQNGDFSSGKTYWSNTAGCTIMTQSDSPNKYAAIRSTQTPVNLTQQINTSGKKGDKFVFSAWARPVNALPEYLRDDESKEFSLKIFGHDVDDPETSADESKNQIVLKSQDFNPYVDEWQYVSGEFTLENDQPSFEVSFQYSYDVDGNNVDVTEFVFRKIAQYDYLLESGDLTKVEKDSVVEEKPTEVKDKYDRVVKSTSPEGYTNHIRYDSYGNQTGSYITNNGGTLWLNRATYDTTGNFVKTSTDAEGNKTEYTYNKDGKLIAILLPNGATHTYTYDSMGRMIEESIPVSGLSDGYGKLSNKYTYNGDKIKKITNNNCTYELDYDNWDNKKSIKIGNQVLESYTYDNPSSGLLQKIDYANGQSESYSYDSGNNIVGIQYSGDNENQFSMLYENNTLKQIYDRVNNMTTVYHDDGLVEEFRGNGTDGTLLHKYYVSDSVFTEKIGSHAVQINYVRDKDKELLQSAYSAFNTDVSADLNYDAYGRLSEESIKVKYGSNAQKQVLWSENTYSCYQDNTTGLLVDSKTYKYANGLEDTYEYSYDQMGNLKEVTCNGELKESYVYDEADQLIRSNNLESNRTYIYKYDSKGNITSKKEYTYTTEGLGVLLNEYEYLYEDENWCDKLTSYDGKNIEYDKMGNPVTYNGNTYIWQRGRQLESIDDGAAEYNYTYDVNGIRTSKTISSYRKINGSKVYDTETKINYTLIDNKITAESDGNNTIYYRYDGNGELMSLNWNGQEYFYQKNLLGDIIGIIDKNGNIVVKYSYDAWGNPIGSGNGISGSMADTLGTANPFRYRGYYYDKETGLYYLNARYYNPQWGRFLNADSMVLNDGITICPNLFAYCANNPVMRVDPTGCCSAFDSGYDMGKYLAKGAQFSAKGMDSYVAAQADHARNINMGKPYVKSQRPTFFSLIWQFFSELFSGSEPNRKNSGRYR